jgi:hypothetical protein
MQSHLSYARARHLVASLGLIAVACGGGDSAPARSQWVTQDEGASPLAETGMDPSDEAGIAAEPTEPVGRATGDGSGPVIHSIEIDPASPVAGDTVRVRVDAGGADGSSPFLAYAWKINGAPVGSGVPKLILDDARKGDRLELEVTASDGRATDVSTLAVRVENAAPTLRRVEVEPAGEISAGQTITLRPDARDRDGDPVEFDYGWSVNGQPVAEQGPTFETGELVRGDEVRAVVVATDGEIDSEPIETPAFVMTNSSPTIVSRPGPPDEDGVFDYQVRAEDPDGSSNLMFVLEQAPEGMEIDARTGRIHWEPKPGQIGTWPIAIVVDDLEGGRTRQVFELSTSDPGSQASPPARVR